MKVLLGGTGLGLSLVLALTGCGSKDDPKMDGTPTGGTNGIPGNPSNPSQPSQPANPGAAGSNSSATGGAGGTTGMTVAGSGAPNGQGGSMAMEQGGSGAPDNMMMPAECRGFSFDNIKYSPGGTTLPNTCMPYHPTLNNPYAVRCVDVWPWYKTNYPGDEFCILPPPPDKGIQYGVHPQGQKWFEQVSAGDMSGYEGVKADFLLQDGQEGEANYYTTTTNDAAQNYYRNYARMRPGSHHMIVSAQAANANPESWGPGSPDGLFGGTSMPGAQRPDENAPKSLDKPPEDKGLYAVLPAKTGITFDMHHFNVTGKPILKEAWTNLWWETDATIPVKGILGLELLQTATLNVPQGQTQDLHYSWDISTPIRMLTIFGHRHAWTTNFTSWVEKPDGKTDIVYQSFNWFDEPTYRYDSETMNPTPAPDALMDGAKSGVFMLNPGEKLHFNCHIEFTNERAAAVNAPDPSSIGTLRFANQAFNAEMCILFGSTAQTSLGTPVSDGSPVPDFATID